MILKGNQIFSEGVQTQLYLFEHKDSENLFPSAAASDIHKGDRGNLWVCAGRRGFWGSGIMAARASVRCGAGYARMLSFDSDVHQISITHPELITVKMKTIAALWKSQKAPSAIVVGPGLGVGLPTKNLLQFLIKKAVHLPVLLDADALTVLAQMAKGKRFPLPSHWLITPHEGEMARLLQQPVEQIHEDRETAIAKAQAQFGCAVVLKGHRTLIMGNAEKMFIIEVGNPALAKAGTGDVLAGMVGGLLAQGYTTEEASLLGCYWHASFADWYVAKVGFEFSLRASEISDLLPLYWKELYAMGN